MQAKAYRKVVEEEYIKPIRSVLIVDDDYPSYEQLLETSNAPNVPKEADLPVRKQTTDGGQQKKAIVIADRIKAITGRLRGPNHSRLLDICNDIDGNGGGDLVGHLHQSDLLILDYHLDDDGRKANAALRKILDNDHFNLVVVHSTALEAENFKSVLKAVTKKAKAFNTKAVTQSAEIVLFEAIQVDLAYEEAAKDFIGLPAYIEARTNWDEAKKKFLAGEQPFTAVHGFCKERNLDRNQSIGFLRWRLDLVNDGFCGAKDLKDFTWSMENCFWIACKEGFLTFVQKADGEDQDVEERLIVALLHWKPTPSQLLISKLRSQIDEVGIVAEMNSLTEKYVHAQWFSQILGSDGPARKSLIDRTTKHYADQIHELIAEPTIKYAERVCDIYWDAGRKTDFDTQFAAANDDGKKGTH